MSPSRASSILLRFLSSPRRRYTTRGDLLREWWHHKRASTHSKASFVLRDACFRAHVERCVPRHVSSSIFCLPEYWIEDLSFSLLSLSFVELVRAVTWACDACVTFKPMYPNSRFKRTIFSRNTY